MAASTNTRTDEDYAIAALRRGLLVLEALKGTTHQAVTIAEIKRRTRLTYDFCRRALSTLKVAGWAVETERGWQLSVKAGQFSENWLAIAASLPDPIRVQR